MISSVRLIEDRHRFDERSVATNRDAAPGEGPLDRDSILGVDAHAARADGSGHRGDVDAAAAVVAGQAGPAVGFREPPQIAVTAVVLAAGNADRVARRRADEPVLLAEASEVGGVDRDLTTIRRGPLDPTGRAVALVPEQLPQPNESTDRVAVTGSGEPVERRAVTASRPPARRPSARRSHAIGIT